MSATATPPGLMQQPSSWDTIAPSYASEIARQMTPFVEEALRLGAVAPSHRVLDVGCGPGSLAFVAARRAAHVVAVDFSTGMVAEVAARAAREDVTNVEALVMDAQSLSFPDGEFDVAFSMFAFMFIPDRARAFREMRRVLRPGGVAVVATWGPIERRPLMQVGFDAMAEVLPDIPRPLKGDLQDPDECVNEMTNAGFEDVVSAPFNASTHLTPEQYMRVIVDAGPLAILRNKKGEDAFRATANSLLEAVRKRIPEQGAELSAEAVMTRGIRGADRRP
jgi:SAM-dependent methyltransferase